MSRFVRASKVRHVFAEQPKKDAIYENFRLSTATGDHNYIKANSQFFAITVASGGSSLCVHKLSDLGRLPASPPVIDGEKGAVLDFDFNPFFDNIVATASDTGSCKVWGFPEGGMEKNIGKDEHLVDLHAHQKKITVVKFHPTAEHVLVTGSADHTVKIWDVQASSDKVTYDLGQMVLDCAWSSSGHLLATSDKNKMVKIWDPRTGTDPISEIPAHDGSKTTKLTFLGDSNNLCTVGFTKQSKRQWKMWDPRKASKAITIQDIDSSAGVIMPFFDEDSSMLYLAGKGDANVRYYELVDDEPWAFYLNEFRTTTPCRGMAMVPKRVVDVTKNELAILLKLTTNTVEPLRFICPRKSDLFQADLYPDTYAGIPSMNAEEYFENKKKVTKPKKVSMDPEKQPEPSQMAKAKATFEKVKSPAELNAELDKANKYIEKLIKLLESKNVPVPEP